MSATKGTTSTPESEEVRAALLEALDRMDALLDRFERAVRDRIAAEEAGR